MVKCKDCHHCKSYYVKDDMRREIEIATCVGDLEITAGPVSVDPFIERECVCYREKKRGD